MLLLSETRRPIRFETYRFFRNKNKMMRNAGKAKRKRGEVAEDAGGEEIGCWFIWVTVG